MKITITAAELPTLLDRTSQSVRILSLDCFDTLIWRNTQAPHDVFADLPVAGGGAWMRMRAEARARQNAAFDRDGTEVSIEEIYRSLTPSASHEEVAEAVECELAAEARHCFAFAPTVDLIRAAKAKGLQVIIVSDTYLSEPQLRRLIGQAAGEDVAAMVDRIFCSSEFGVCKGGGLFEPVLEELGVTPSAILHVGDNKNADQKAPSLLGLCTAHLRQFDPACEQRLRLEAAAAAILDPSVRVSSPAYQPHRPALSLRDEQEPVWALGHDVLGPIFHAFAAWVRSEAEEMAERTGKPTKLLFLLRDGHLPKRVFDVAFGGATGAVELSRFTARRAGFTDEAAVLTYLAAQGKHERIDVLARQLGLSKEEGQKLSRGRLSPQQEFTRAVLTPQNLRKIVARSEAFADRLFAHLQRAGVERGDSVMMVDLGYNGTVQNHVERVLTERFDLNVAGRYLLLREEELTGFDKKGLLDSRHYDTNALHALCGPIAVLEQLCTIAQGSVVDYSPKGEPIRKGAGAKGVQNAIRDRIQDGCVAFAEKARQGVLKPAASDDADCRRRMAAGALARLLFMPAAAEVSIFEAFEHDVNLGTNDLVQLLDVEESAKGLRRRGLFYLTGVDRMYLPGEVQPHGLPLNLSLFSANRFGLDLRSGDFRTGAIKLPVLVADDRTQTMIEVEAHATHDGYYCATVPIGAGRFAVGIQFGAVCDWLQIDECAFHPVDGFAASMGEGAPEPIEAQVVREGMTEEAPGFFRCTPGALMLAPPPSGVRTPHLLAVTFRPLVLRQQTALKKAA
jgi:FMN phosphatase YigB (HAD superfamily)